MDIFLPDGVRMWFWTADSRDAVPAEELGLRAQSR